MKNDKDKSTNKNDDSVVNLRDFMDHETRISLVEHAIIGIEGKFSGIDDKFKAVDERFKEVDKRFDKVDEKIDKMRDRMDTHFKWTLVTIVIPLVTGIILRVFHVI